MLAVEPEDRPDAAAVHEFCEGLAQRIQGASLRKWAGAHVRSEVAELDELSGTVVMESIALESAFASLAGVMETTGATLAAPTTTLTTVTTGSAASTMETVVLPIEAPVAPPSSGSRSLLAVGVAALVLGGIAMGIGCYGLWLADPFGTPAVVPAPVPIEPAEPVPLPDPSEPVPVEPVAPEPAPEPVVVDPVPQPTVVRPVQPVPAPVEPVEPASPVPEPVVVPAPVEPPAPTCSVRVKADDVLVIVRDAQGAKVRPGPVPCGTYTIAVAFDPSTPSGLESQDPVGLSDGQVLDLTCSAGLRRCITKIR